MEARVDSVLGNLSLATNVIRIPEFGTKKINAKGARISEQVPLPNSVT